MSVNLEIGLGEDAAENDINCAHAGQILGKILQNDVLRDTTLVAGVDGQKFPVHRVVMISASKYFQALLGPDFKEGQQQEVVIPEMVGSTLKAVIDFCYTGNIQIADENIMAIVSAASATELVQIEKKCEQFWSDKLAESNCVDIFLMADTYSLVDLRRKSLDFICTYFTNKDILKLEFPFFAEILKRDRIPHDEIKIFSQFCQWVQYDEENRSKHAPDLSKFIRLSKIATSAFPLFVEPSAKKYNFFWVVIAEYRRRMLSDDNIFNPYRYSTDPVKNIFFAKRMKNMISIEVLNPISERWKSMFSAYVMRFEERSNFGLIFTNDQTIIIGGRKGSSLLRTVESSQPLRQGWMDNARENFHPILLNDDIYIFGGWNGSAMRSCECISVASMTTKTLQPMQSGRHSHSAVIFKGKIYVAGGCNSAGSYLNSVECYDPAEDNWTESASMNHPRTRFSLVEHGGELYAIGHHELSECYNPATNVWTVITHSKHGEVILRAIRLRDTIYVLLKNGQFGILHLDSDWRLTLLSRVTCHCAREIILDSNNLTST